MIKKLTAEDAKDINELIAYFNFFHDACMRRICFHKAREVDKDDGSIIFPFADFADAILSTIEIELLHNNYQHAKKDQIILLRFYETTNFVFNQDTSFDYSDVYELKFKCDESGLLSFVFFAKATSFLSIKCRRLLCLAE